MQLARSGDHSKTMPLKHGGHCVRALRCHKGTVLHQFEYRALYKFYIFFHIHGIIKLLLRPLRKVYIYLSHINDKYIVNKLYLTDS